jgi:hypothetical protein
LEASRPAGQTGWREVLLGQRLGSIIIISSSPVYNSSGARSRMTLYSIGQS